MGVQWWRVGDCVCKQGGELEDGVWVQNLRC